MAVQARIAGVESARKTIGQLDDETMRQHASRRVVEALTRLGKPDEALRVLQAHPPGGQTGEIWLTLARAQAGAGHIDEAVKCIERIGQFRDDEFVPVRQAIGYIAVAAARARAGDRDGYLQSLARARNLTKDFRQPYSTNTLSSDFPYDTGQK